MLIQFSGVPEIFRKLSYSEKLRPKWLVQTSETDEPDAEIKKHISENLQTAIPKLDNIGFKLIGASDAMKDINENSLTLFYRESTEDETKFVLHILPVECDFVKKLNEQDSKVRDGVNHFSIDTLSIVYFEKSKLEFIIVHFDGDLENALKIAAEINKSTNK